ncbi:uncharacterized protein METZ01_LOCUS486488, partial [marine metagenome]
WSTRGSSGACAGFGDRVRRRFRSRGTRPHQRPGRIGVGAVARDLDPARSGNGRSGLHLDSRVLARPVARQDPPADRSTRPCPYGRDTDHLRRESWRRTGLATPLRTAVAGSVECPNACRSRSGWWTGRGPLDGRLRCLGADLPRQDRESTASLSAGASCRREFWRFGTSVVVERPGCRDRCGSHSVTPAVDPASGTSCRVPSSGCGWRLEYRARGAGVRTGRRGWILCLLDQV